MRLVCFLIFLFVSATSFSQDSLYLKIHFLYGSKPMKQCRDTEKKWFGGILGGHAGIEGGNNEILSFSPYRKFHWLSKKNNKHSKYTLRSENSFYAILGGNPDSVKKTVVYIPVTAEQKKAFDSISKCYLEDTPYDYAFIGMRCGAATYEVLGKLGIMTPLPHTQTYLKVFYPKKLRKPLLKKAKANGWRVECQQGSSTRKWEKD